MSYREWTYGLPYDMVYYLLNLMDHESLCVNKGRVFPVGWGGGRIRNFAGPQIFLLGSGKLRRSDFEPLNLKVAFCEY